jgi:amino acid transporter
MKRKINLFIVAIYLILFSLDYFNIFSGQNEFGLCILLLSFLQVGLLLFMLTRYRTGRKSESLFLVKKKLKSSGNFYDLFLTLMLLYFTYWGFKELLDNDSIYSLFHQKPETSLKPNSYLVAGMGILNFAGSLLNRLKPHYSFQYKDNKLQVFEEDEVLFQLYNDSLAKMSFQNGEIRFKNHNNEEFHVMKNIWINERKFRVLLDWLQRLDWKH